MKENQIGSIVQFTGNEWGVYGRADAVDKKAELFGVALLVAAYFARLYGLVRKNNEARELLVSCLQDPSLIRAAVSKSMDMYERFYKKGGVSLHYDLTRTASAKRQSSFVMSYDLDGSFIPNFRSKGFGLLGVNVEAVSVGACLSTAVFFIDSHSDDSDFESTVLKTIKTVGDKILHLDKLSIREEVAIVKETALSVVG